MPEAVTRALIWGIRVRGGRCLVSHSYPNPPLIGIRPASARSPFVAEPNDLIAVRNYTAVKAFRGWIFAALKPRGCVHCKAPRI
eukprot:3565098-Prymnesium_polylepis.1